jgi:hypothetical protein
MFPIRLQRQHEDDFPRESRSGDLLSWRKHFDNSSINVSMNVPAPAAAHSGQTVLSTFDGTNPNGAWKLWVFDEVTNDEGRLGRAWTP